MKNIEYIKKDAIKYSYAHKGAEFYAVELEAMDKAIEIKTLTQKERRSLREFLGF